MNKPSQKSFDPIPPLSLEFVYADESNCVVELEYNQREPDQDLHLQILLTADNDYKWVEEEYFKGEKRSKGKFTHRHPEKLKEIHYALVGIPNEPSDISKLVTRTVEF